MTTHRTRALSARALAVMSATALVAGACLPPAEEAGLTVFAAASLRTVMDDLDATWQREHPDVPLTVSTQASNVLAAQIAEGAPADVFLSADVERPRELAEAGLTAAAPVSFASNRVTLVVAADSERLTTPLDVAQPGVRLVGSHAGVPIARYTAEAVEALAQTTSDPLAFVEAVESNLVSREDNVRAALAKVELGEGDAAFVYSTDALASAETRELPLPPTAAAVTDYAAVQVSDRAAAAEFVAWLDDPAAVRVFQAAGFEPAR